MVRHKNEKHKTKVDTGMVISKRHVSSKGGPTEKSLGQVSIIVEGPPFNCACGRTFNTRGSKYVLKSFPIFDSEQSSRSLISLCASSSS